MQRIRVKYSKDILYIGHLDMVRLWERALRRIDITTVYSQGFNPRQKLSFGPPLPLGISSNCELLDIFVENWINPELLKQKLNDVLPDGIKIIEAKNIFEGIKALTAEITAAVYEIYISQRMTINNIAADLLARKEIVSVRKDKSINIRPMIKEIKAESGKVILMCQCDNFGSLKKTEIESLFEGLTITGITRTELF